MRSKESFLSEAVILDAYGQNWIGENRVKLIMDDYAKEVHFAYKQWIEKIVEDDGLMGQYKYMTDAQLFDEFFKTIA